MSDFPKQSQFLFHGGGVLSTAQALLGLQHNVASASTAWPSANRAILVPVRLAIPAIAYKMAIGSGVTASGNFDVGIYDSEFNRLVSSGSTAKGNSVESIANITDTPLEPGLYYLALAANGANNYIMQTPSGTSPVPLQKARLMGTLEMASAFALPATITPAARSSAEIPYIAAYLRKD